MQFFLIFPTKMTTKLFGICRYILTLRMAKQGYNALHTGRRRIHSNFYTCVVLFLCFAFICLVNPPFYLQFLADFARELLFGRYFTYIASSICSIVSSFPSTTDKVMSKLNSQMFSLVRANQTRRTFAFYFF